MRWQKNAFTGWRLEGLGHPNPTRHTAETYRQACKSQRLGYLRRLRRMEWQEMEKEALNGVR